MTKVNIHEAKTHLSRYIARVQAGEVITLCRRNVPVAELRPVDRPEEQRRRLGQARERFGEWRLEPSFHEPLDEDLLAAFEGVGDSRP